MRLLLLPLIAMSLPAMEHPVFLENGGIIMIEAESTASRLGKWKLMTSVEGFSGSGHLEFTGNKPESGKPDSPLTYRFTVSKAGNYTLVLRGHKNLVSKRDDICNDCYVALDGDFESGNKTPAEVLAADTKMFGGSAEGWGWCRQLDADHKKWDPVYVLEPGEVYEFTVHGRSQNFNLDAILFVHESTSLRNVLKSLPKESERSVDKPSGGRATPVNRALTHRDGRTIDATLLSRSGGQITVRVNGRNTTIPLEILSEEDREFIDRWSPE